MQWDDRVLLLDKMPMMALDFLLKARPIVMSTRQREGLAFCSEQWDRHSRVRRTVLVFLDLRSVVFLLP